MSLTKTPDTLESKHQKKVQSDNACDSFLRLQPDSSYLLENPIRTGFLYKRYSRYQRLRSLVGSKWQKRYVELYADKMVYYKQTKRGGRKTRGYVLFGRDMRVVDCGTDTKGRYVFILETDSSLEESKLGEIAKKVSREHLADMAKEEDSAASSSTRSTTDELSPSHQKEKKSDESDVDETDHPIFKKRERKKKELILAAPSLTVAKQWIAAIREQIKARRLSAKSKIAKAPRSRKNSKTSDSERKRAQSTSPIPSETNIQSSEDSLDKVDSLPQLQGTTGRPRNRSRLRGQSIFFEEDHESEDEDRVPLKKKSGINYLNYLKGSKSKIDGDHLPK
eukprot:g4107.t1